MRQSVVCTCLASLCSSMAAKSKKAVSFSDQVSFAETEGGVEAESDFDYIESESSSELLTSDEAEDAENLEAVFGALLCAGSPSKPRIPPAERESLLRLDKDLLEEEDLESSESGKFCWFAYATCFTVFQSPRG